jgi:hypothetical protein
MLTRPPKDKIVLCVSVDPGPYFLWFNTLPRPHGDGQLAIAETEHSAISRDCYLDCSRMTTFSPIELATAAARDLASPGMLGKVLGFLEREPPRALPGRHRALIIEALRAALPAS